MTIVSDTISGIIINLPWFILFYLGFRMIAKEIRAGVKAMPSWINQFFKLQHEQSMKDFAMQRAAQRW